MWFDPSKWLKRDFSVKISQNGLKIGQNATLYFSDIDFSFLLFSMGNMLERREMGLKVKESVILPLKMTKTWFFGQNKPKWGQNWSKTLYFSDINFFFFLLFSIGNMLKHREMGLKVKKHVIWPLKMTKTWFFGQNEPKWVKLGQNASVYFARTRGRRPSAARSSAALDHPKGLTPARARSARASTITRRGSYRGRRPHLITRRGSYH